MLGKSSRRHFLQTAACGGTLAGLGNLGFLAKLPRVSAAEEKLDSQSVRMQPEIEPLVRLLEETPRDQLLEEVAGRIRRGLSYREILAALLLAGVKNVQPRPHVGFKFHTVLVVNSAHLASLSSPPEHRWLPIFWALDYFKSAQAQDVNEGNWTMSRVDESKVPSAGKARQAFIQAMDNWDEEAADAAIAGLARTAGAGEIYELMFRYGSRDFRSIGHKAIYVANSRRTLQCIGWRHAEPVLRSLAYALLNHEGEPNPSQSDLEADRPWRSNRQLATKFRDDWLSGNLRNEATSELLATLREGSYQDCTENVVELINQGTAPQSIWDALLVGAGELLVRQPGIVALHAVTSSNALRYAYQAGGNDNTRRLLLLQGASFLPLFRRAMHGRGDVRPYKLDRLTAEESPDRDKITVDEIFHDISKDRMAAANKVVTYLGQKGNPQDLINAARLHIFFKGKNTHDYKFSSAVLEDFYNVSPAWRDRYLAASVFNLRGSGHQDNALVTRIRAALSS